MSEEQLLDKAPMSAAMHPGTEVLPTDETMETEDCKFDQFLTVLSPGPVRINILLLIQCFYRFYQF